MRIRFNLRAAGGNTKISAIKAMRTTLDIGLKEAKDLVDALEARSFSSQAVVMSEAQFGRLSAYLHQVATTPSENQPLYITDVVIETNINNELDFTVNTHAKPV